MRIHIGPWVCITATKAAQPSTTQSWPNLRATAQQVIALGKERELGLGGSSMRIIVTPHCRG